MLSLYLFMSNHVMLMFYSLFLQCLLIFSSKNALSKFCIIEWAVNCENCLFTIACSTFACMKNLLPCLGHLFPASKGHPLLKR